MLRVDIKHYRLWKDAPIRFARSFNARVNAHRLNPKTCTIDLLYDFVYSLAFEAGSNAHKREDFFFNTSIFIYFKKVWLQRSYRSSLG